MGGRSIRIAVVLVLGLAACVGASADADCEAARVPAHSADTIVIEGDPWSGYAPFRDPDLLDDTGYTALYVEQLCQQARFADLTSGRADIAVTTLDQYVLNEADATLVGVIDQSLGADALALDTVRYPFLESIDDLPELIDVFNRRGDRPVLAYTGSSPSEMLLNELANTFEELNPADFELVSVDQSAAAYEMLQDGDAQLAVVWEPDTSSAREEGYTIVLSSADVPDSIVDVIVASDVLIERDPDWVQAVIESFYTRMDELLEDPRQLVDLVATDGGLDQQAARQVIEGIKLYGTEDADEFMNDPVFPLDQPQVQQSVDAIASLLALVEEDIRPERATVDGSYVRAANAPPFEQ
jgi:OOP family OmpA-OmpF porin